MYSNISELGKVKTRGLEANEAKVWLSNAVIKNSSSIPTSFQVGSLSEKFNFSTSWLRYFNSLGEGKLHSFLLDFISISDDGAKFVRGKVTHLKGYLENLNLKIDDIQKWSNDRWREALKILKDLGYNDSDFFLPAPLGKVKFISLEHAAFFFELMDDEDATATATASTSAQSEPQTLKTIGGVFDAKLFTSMLGDIDKIEDKAKSEQGFEELLQVFFLSPNHPDLKSQLNKRYRKSSFFCHPDKNPDMPQAEAYFKLLNKIKEVLDANI